MRAWMRILGLAASLTAGLFMTSSLASAYYYWIFIGTGTGAPLPLPGRFDLTALQDNTVPFFISNQAPVGVVADDTQVAVYSQIRKAANVWNSVATSALKLRFGGVSDITVPQTSPGIDVVFDDDLPPGILAQSKPTFPEDLTFLSNKGTTFVPILRSRLQLRADLAAQGLEQPSYVDTFFLTLVHEFGHTVGLQHTLTSAVMSTSITRATKKGSPLAADDIAAISTLYPRPERANSETTGSITGQVTLSGNGVNLASVVALSANGTAISGMTNPDGTYRIDGIPPGPYFVYAHPLPPAQTGEGHPANIIAPIDLAGDDFSANTHFDTRFYPGTKDWTKAGVVAVAAGVSTGKIDFAMADSSGPTIYGMETYGYRVEAMAAPPLKSESKGNPIVFKAPGTVTTGFLGAPLMVPGLNVGVIGNAAQIEGNAFRYYTNGFLLMYVDAGKVTAPTPVSFAVTVNDELYILPAAFTVEPNGAPQIDSVTPSTLEDGTQLVTIAGQNLSPSTQILFDGAAAALLSVNEDGSWVMSPPVAPGGHKATVEAVNSDGQTSILGLPVASRALYGFADRDAAALQISPGSIIAGTDGIVVVQGTNAHFVAGRTVVGFGTSDVSVRRLWVLSPTLLAMNVSVGPGVTLGPLTFTVATDLEMLTNADSLQAAAADPQQISLRVPVTNAVTGLAGVPAGGTALIRTTGLPQEAAGWTLTVGGIVTSFTVDKSGGLAVQIPAELGVGPQLVRLTKPDGSGPQAIVMQVDGAPPVILSAFDNTTSDGKGAVVTAGAPARADDTITLTVAQLNAAGEVWINLNGSYVWAVSVGAPDKDGLSAVTFKLPGTLPFDPQAVAQSVTLNIGTGTRLSAPFALLTQVDPPKVN